MPSPKQSLIALLAAALSLTAQPVVQLLPAGEFAARDGRPGPGKSWKLDDAAGRTLAQKLTARAAKTPFLFDVDHQTIRAETNGQPAPAAGWATKFEWRPGQGLFALDARWTERAQGWIEAGEYGYVSPVIATDPDTGLVTDVLMAAIVNHPALLGMAPLGLDAATRLQALLCPDNDPSLEPTMTLIERLIASLGLKAGATEAEALSAVDALKAKAAAPAALSGQLVTALGLAAGADEAAALQAITTLKGGDKAALSAITALQAQVADLTAKATAGQVDALIAKGIADRKLLPAMQGWATELGKRDLAALQAYLAAAPVVLAGQDGQSGGKDPGPGGIAALSAEQSEMLTLMGISEEAWRKEYGQKA